MAPGASVSAPETAQYAEYERLADGVLHPVRAELARLYEHLAVQRAALEVVTDPDGCSAEQLADARKLVLDKDGDE